MENSPMKILRLAATTSALLLSLGASLQAQTTLRIGLAEDPDILDPSLGRTYVGRIVFASFCDKLFDIDEKLNIVPQLALSHETSDDGKEVFIKLRPGVKFHDGEPFDAEAAKFSLDRHVTLPASFRKPELAQLDHVDVVDPQTIKLVLKTPFSPLIAQLTDRAGMMVSPKAVKEAGDKFGLKPVCAGPYKFVERVQQDRIVFEKFADYWNKDKGPLSQSAKVRQALDLSIDREAINQVVFNGEFKPGNQWVNPDHPYYQKAFPVRGRDAARAKALLKEAGVTAPVSVDFMVPKGAETEAVAQVIQSMAAETGFDMKLRVTEFATSLKQAEAGEYQAYMLAWSGRIDPDGNSYIFLKTNAPQNYSAWFNPDADKALDDARLVTDQAQRMAIYQKLTKFALDEEPLLYIYHRRILIAHTTRLEGYKQMPDGLVRVVGLKLK